MRTLFKHLLAGVVVALGIVSMAQAQAPAAPVYAAPASAAPSAEEPPRFSQAELDSMLAPIALYPDSLLSQLLMAATYPRDIAEAAAWSRANRQAAGEQAVRAVANQPWDPSVKSLMAFPQVLAMMDEHMEWTERLGDAFMANPPQVSETIQGLRGRADQAGNLRSSPEMNVQRDYGSYVIEPTQPEVVYVPYYDPRVVYGPWWWPNYAPVWWSPWAGYAWTPGYAFAWGYGVAVGPGYWYSGFDWPRRYVRFYSTRPYYYRGHSHSYGHRWYSDHDHNRNTRGYQWSGYRGNDGRYSGQGGQRGSGRTAEQARRAERAPAPAGTTGMQRYESAPPRAPTEQRYAVPSAGRAPERSQEYQAGPSTQPQSRSAGAQSPGSQPLSRGAVAPSQPMPRFESQPQQQPVQQAPVQHRAPAPQHAAQPAPSPAARAPQPAPERSAPSESRPQRAEPAQADSRSDPAARSGGGGSRGGSRSDRM